MAEETIASEQTRAELKAMTQAAVERERAYARREEEWRAKVVSAMAQANAAKCEAEQLHDKLVAAEGANRELAAQAVHTDGMLRNHGARIEELTAQMSLLQEANQSFSVQAVQMDERLRAQVAQIGGLESVKKELAGQIAAMEKQQQAWDADRRLLEARINELSHARSRRLLLKLGLVHHCSWESK